MMQSHKLRVSAGILMQTVVAFVFLVAGTGCKPTTVPVSGRLIRPGEVNMAGYKQVTIVVDGPNSTQLEALLKQALGKTDFEVLDRTTLNVRNGEIALRQLGVAGGPEPVEKIIPAVVLFRAKVLSATASEHPVSGQFSDQNGNVHVRYASAATASVQVTFDVIDLATSRQIVSKLFENTQNLQGGWGAGPFGEAQLNSMLANANVKVIGQFLSTVMPHYEDLNLVLYPNSKFPANETGIRLYQSGDYQQAAKQFEEALAVAKTQPDIKPADIAALSSNLGMAYEFGGRVAEALELYKAAAGLDSRAEYSQSVARCNLRLSERQKLQDQGIK